LYGGLPSSQLNSQLTYSNLTANAGEIFGRVEHLSGFFLKGYFGLSALNSGNLKDEDFPPATTPYSSTNSDQHGGQLKYATVDVGWDMRSENLRLGVFAGYLYYSEQLNAYGCTQTASNPGICVPTIPNSVLVITDDATWNAMRLGGFVQWTFGYGFSLTTEAAWLPVGFLAASDFHWLRPDLIKPIPENGAAFAQVQLEALLNYQFTPSFSVGVGGRYWNIGNHGGASRLPGGSVGTNAINFKTETWGAFVQASYKFGDLRQNSHP
jgi:outer membrane protease